MTAPPLAWPARFALHGPGRAGTVLARWLQERGATLVALSGGGPEGAGEARAVLGEEVPWTPEPTACDVDAWIVATPDGALEEAAERLAALEPVAGDTPVHFHLSGARGPEALEALAKGGHAVGVLHPLATFPTRRTARAGLEGALAAISGSSKQVIARLEALGEALGARPFVLEEAGRSGYHLAASLAHNAVVAMLGLAESILLESGCPADAARAGLLHLTRDGLTATEQMGARAALTGPAARGDRSTLSAHRQAMADHDQGRIALWRELVALQLETARERLGEERHGELVRWLEEGEDRP